MTEFPSKADLLEEEEKSIFDDYEQISLHESPIELRWVYPPMYKTSQTQGTLYWRVGFDGFTNELVTEHGYETTSTGKQGKYQVDRLELHSNNLNKNILDKALQDAYRAYENKYKDGYSDESGNVLNIPQPQKGKPYENQLKPSHFGRGVIVQAKLDGIRARCWKINGKIEMYSNLANQFPWFETIKAEADRLLRYLPPGVGIDGELYNNDMTFQTITSVVKTRKTKHPLNDELKYFLFDIILFKTDYETRISILKDAYNKASKDVPFTRIVLLSYVIVHDRESIDAYHKFYVSEYGYEGLILRKALGLEYFKTNGKTITQKEIEETWYKPGKNSNFFKIKNFIDEEGVVLDIVTGEGRESNLALVQIKDIRGNIFTVRPRGSFGKRQEWLLSKQKYIGKKYTFRYQELSDTGVPRFPVGIAFRDYE